MHLARCGGAERTYQVRLAGQRLVPLYAPALSPAAGLMDCALRQARRRPEAFPFEQNDKARSGSAHQKARSSFKHEITA